MHVAPTTEGPRAISKNALVKPDAVERYLRGKFGSQLCAALSAMERLAATMSTDTLNDEAIRLYKHFGRTFLQASLAWMQRASSILT